MQKQRGYMHQNRTVQGNICKSLLGFPDSSVGKESACNAGGPGLIPASGRSAGEGIDYPLQCS